MATTPCERDLHRTLRTQTLPLDIALSEVRSDVEVIRGGTLTPVSRTVNLGLVIGDAHLDKYVLSVLCEHYGVNDVLVLRQTLTLQTERKNEYNNQI